MTDDQPHDQPPQTLRQLAPMTLAIGALCLAAFVWLCLRGVPVMEPTAQQLIDAGGSLALRVQGGEPWRLVTAVFLHAGLIHLVANGFALLSIGPLVETRFGSRATFLLFVLTGVLGNVLGIVWHPNTVAVGASGGVFGLFGVYCALLWRRRAWFEGAAHKAALRGLLITLGINLAYGLSAEGIDMAAHAGGGVAGLLLGLLALPDSETRTVPWPRIWAATGLVLVGTVTAVVALPEPVDLAALGRKMDAVESETIRQYNQLLVAAQETSDGSVLADRMQRNVAGPWHDAFTPLQAAVTDLKVKDPKFLTILGYLEARDKAWAATVTSLRTGLAAERQKTQALLADVDARMLKLLEKPVAPTPLLQARGSP